MRSRRKAAATVGRGEVLRDSRGRVVDDAYVDDSVEDALQQVRGRGRPSLSESGVAVAARPGVSRDLDAAVREAAHQSGETFSDRLRRTLERATRGTS